MQNLHLLVSPADETSVTNRQPRLSLCLTPPSDRHLDQLSPNSLVSLSSSSADNSLASISILASSGESLTSIGRPSKTANASNARNADQPVDLDQVVEIQLVDLSTGDPGHFSASPDDDNGSANRPAETKLQRWRHGHFGTHSIDNDPRSALAYYPQPRRGFSPLAVVVGGGGKGNDDSQHQRTTNCQTSNRSLLGPSNYQHCYLLISPKILDEDLSPDLPSCKIKPTATAADHPLEVKRIHSRMVKLKTVADLEKLAKLIKKARRQLELDTKRWLAEAIIFNGFRPIGGPRTSAEQELKPATARFSRTPSRVVYTLRLDVHRLKLGQLSGLPDTVELSAYSAAMQNATQRSSLHDSGSLKSILKSMPLKPQATRRKRRPVSADEHANELPNQSSAANKLEIDPSRTRPASSLAIDTYGQKDIATADMQKIHQQQRRSSPKHVQFRIIRPSSGGGGIGRGGYDDAVTTRKAAASRGQMTTSATGQQHPNVDDGGKRSAGTGRRRPEEAGERRLWISENLFVSSSMGEDKSLLDVAAALIKIYFSGQWKMAAATNK